MSTMPATHPAKQQIEETYRAAALEAIARHSMHA
jgi:hypothetical protein